MVARAVCLVVLWGFTPTSLFAEDWPQFLGPTRDGAYHGNDLASEWPREGPRILWHAPTGQGFSGPVVAEGKVILFHRIEKNEICLELGPDEGGCYQVWLAGKKIELRREGSSLSLEGVLDAPKRRN